MTQSKQIRAERKHTINGYPQWEFPILVSDSNIAVLVISLPYLVSTTGITEEPRQS